MSTSRYDLCHSLLSANLRRGDADETAHRPPPTVDELCTAAAKRMTMIYILKRTAACDDRGPYVVLLGHKARGFGAGNWNAFGGKLENEVDASIAASALRELHEECNVELDSTDSLEHVGVLFFQYPDQPIHKQFLEVHLFVVFEDDVTGTLEPQESEEMNPIQWFHLDELPLAKMWKDDSYWLARFLDGCVKARVDGAKYRFAAFFQFVGMTAIDSFNIIDTNLEGEVDQERTEWLDTALQTLTLEYVKSRN